MAARMLLLIGLLPLASLAQTSAELDACVQAELRSEGTKSTIGGLLNSLAENMVNKKFEDQKGNSRTGGMRLSLNNDADPLEPALTYFGALDRCLSKNPKWTPASQQVRGADADTIGAIVGYRPEQGRLAKAAAIDGPNDVAPGRELLLEGRLWLLTPHGEEAEVQIERRLYLRAQGQERELRLLVPTQESRVLPAGESVDVARVAVPRELPSGVQFRYVLSVRIGGQPASSSELGVDVH